MTSPKPLYQKGDMVLAQWRTKSKEYMWLPSEVASVTLPAGGIMNQRVVYRVWLRGAAPPNLYAYHRLDSSEKHYYVNEDQMQVLTVTPLARMMAGL